MPLSLLLSVILLGSAGGSEYASVPQIVDGLADACLAGARDSLCEPVKALSSQLEAIQQQLTALRPAPEECPAGWSHHDDSCYLIPPQTSTWLQAHRACALLDPRARLASVHPASSQHVQALVTASDTDRVWLGLTRLPGNRWGWSDATALDYTNWRRGEPNNGDSGEHCGHVYGPRNSLKDWNDTECDRECHFLCQIRLG